MPGRGRAEKRAELGYGDGDVLFSFVGRLVTDKGIPELVDCFVRLHSEHPEAKLLLIERCLQGRSMVGMDVVELAPLPGLHHADFTAAKLTQRLMGLMR